MQNLDAKSEMNSHAACASTVIAPHVTATMRAAVIWHGDEAHPVKLSIICLHHPPLAILIFLSYAVRCI